MIRSVDVLTIIKLLHNLSEKNKRRMMASIMKSINNKF